MNRLIKIFLMHILVFLYWVALYIDNNFDNLKFRAIFISTLYILIIFVFIIIAIRSKKEINLISFLFTTLPFLFCLQKDFKFKWLMFLIISVSFSVSVRKFFDNSLKKDFDSKRIMAFWIKVFLLSILFYIAFLLIFNIFTLIEIILCTHIILFFAQIILFIYIREINISYSHRVKPYYLSEYMANERDEFARIIHDEIIQDIYAVRNYLSLKKPDILVTKKILMDLEKRLRKIMKFYQSNLFEKADFETSILSIFENIAYLYSQKSIDVTYDIDHQLIESLNPKLSRVVSIITKELINNIYKHSKANYIKYEIKKEYENIIINVESDGANYNDFINIQNSKRGVLLLILLIDANYGHIFYDLEQNILKTKVILEEK